MMQIIKDNTYEVTVLHLNICTFYPWVCVDDIEAKVEQKLHQYIRKASGRRERQMLWRLCGLERKEKQSC